MARSPSKKAQTDRRVRGPDPAVRAKILAAFSSRAKRDGIRSVVMGELATELRMSAMTLYKYFRSKDDLVAAMINGWVDELAVIDALDWSKVDSCKSALDVLAAWADAWTTNLSGINPAFFVDLQRDHTLEWKQFQAQLDKRKWAAAKYLLPFLRDDISPVAELMMLNEMVMKAADPVFMEQLGLSRREAVRTAISIWGGGALKQRAILSPIKPMDLRPGLLRPGGE